MHILNIKANSLPHNNNHKHNKNFKRAIPKLTLNKLYRKQIIIVKKKILMQISKSVLLKILSKVLQKTSILQMAALLKQIIIIMRNNYYKIH